MLLCSLVGSGESYIERKNTEFYCVGLRVSGRKYRDELVLNATMSFVRVWGKQYR